MNDSSAMGRVSSATELELARLQARGLVLRLTCQPPNRAELSGELFELITAVETDVPTGAAELAFLHRKRRIS